MPTTLDFTNGQGRRPDLLTRREAAAYIGFSESWLAHNRKNGPTFTRIGRRIYYLKGDLDAFITRSRQEATCPSTAPPRTDPGGPRSPTADRTSTSPLGQQIAEKLRSSCSEFP